MAEEALRQGEEHYRQLVELASDGIVIIQDNKIQYANPSLAELAGYKVKEVLGTLFIDYFPEDERPKVLDYHKRRMAGAEVPASYETVILAKDGTRIDVEFTASVITYQDRPAALAIARDMRGRKSLEAQLQQAQKMEAMGTLAGGIAHNFNNVLMSILANTSLMLMHTDPGHPHYERLMNIEKAVQSGSKMTRQLLGYARKGGYDPRPFELNQVITEISETFGLTKREIRIHQDLAPDLHVIEADRWQMEQVLMNLYVNASDAMGEGGDLYIKTENTTHRQMSEKPYKVLPGQYAKITVRDTGEGMSPETAKKIFEPFFTTKEPGKGTGLGLASVYGIVKAHGGYIEVKASRGKGATFEIFLPAAKKEAVRDAPRAAGILKGSECLLLVDDEELILEPGKTILEEMGYRVLTARSGAEAVQVYRSHGHEIDLVILDMIMPGLSGAKVYAQLRAIRPDVKVLLASGYEMDHQARELLEQGCSDFIHKPFDVVLLSRRLRELLEK
jgi:PAS domain S-box-containing protein